MDDTQRLLAYQQIRNLAAGYAVALDARDLDSLVALFVPDVRVGRNTVGREALRGDFERQLRAIGVSFLNVGSHWIELLDADHARGVVYCKAELEDGARWIHQAIQYHDRYERRAGHWYFVQRRHCLVYGQEQSPSPLAQEKAQWPESSTGRGSVPWSLESWQRFWKREH